eukprot:scaffold8059_cov315-Pinguiococcus_pyrenoidosus.AAC.3
MQRSSSAAEPVKVRNVAVLWIALTFPSPSNEYRVMVSMSFTRGGMEGFFSDKMLCRTVSHTEKLSSSSASKRRAMHFNCALYALPSPGNRRNTRLLGSDDPCLPSTTEPLPTMASVMEMTLKARSATILVASRGPTVRSTKRDLYSTAVPTSFRPLCSAASPPNSSTPSGAVTSTVLATVVQVPPSQSGTGALAAAAEAAVLRWSCIPRARPFVERRFDPISKRPQTRRGLAIGYGRPQQQRRAQDGYPMRELAASQAGRAAAAEL